MGQKLNKAGEKTKEETFEVLKELEAKLGYSFNDLSMLHEARFQILNRKEAFFGDAILNFIVSDFLFKRYMDLEQGPLTNLKSRLVCDETLEKIVQKNGWDKYIILRGGAHKISQKTSSSFLEAVVGIIYLDGGLEEAKKFVRRHIVNEESVEKSIRSLISPKVKLLIFCQQHFSDFCPKAVLVSDDGPAHDKTFVMRYLIPKEMTGLKTDIKAEGTGKTKLEAENMAASKVNRHLIRIGLMDKECVEQKKSEQK